MYHSCLASMVLSTNDADNYLRLLSDDPDDYDIRRIDSRVIFIFKKSPPEIIYRRIDKVNDRLFFRVSQRAGKTRKTTKGDRYYPGIVQLIII